MAVIRSRILIRRRLATSRPTGADHEEFDERAALCCAKKGGQDQGQARARQVGHSGGARARSRNGAAVCGPAFNDAPFYRVAEAPSGRKVQREVLTGQAAIHPLLLERQRAEQPCIASAQSSPSSRARSGYATELAIVVRHAPWLAEEAAADRLRRPRWRNCQL